MKDIKKAIEEERNEAYYRAISCLSCADEEHQGYKDGYDTGIDKGIEIVLSKWEESTRWRKVEEELPEVKDGSYYILVKVDNTIEEEYQTLLIYKGDSEESIKRLLRVYAVTEFTKIKQCLLSIEWICEHLSIDLWQHVELKLKYNATRPHKHNKSY